MSIVFFDNGCNLNPMRVALSIKNKAQEAWFEEQIEQSPAAEVVDRRIESANSDMTGIDALILLRKNRSGGVEDPVQIARKFIDTNPKGYILFIVGGLDHQGRQQVEQIKEMGCRLFLAASKGNAPLGEEAVRKPLSDMLSDWEICQNSVYLLKGAKGGCGTTTMAVHLANYFAEQQSVALVESRPSSQYHQLAEKVQVFHQQRITAEEIKQLQKQYTSVVLDEVEIEDEAGEISVKNIVVIDGSPESIAIAKKLQADSIVLNQACPEVLPAEVVEHELGQRIDLQVGYDRPVFLQAMTTGEPAVKDVEVLLK